MTSSPACWATYGRVLAAQYGNPERMRFQQLVVDAYAAQHPGLPSGSPDPRAVQSVGIHLMTLCLFLEHGIDPELGPGLHRRMVHRPVFHALPPPDRAAPLTCADLPIDASDDEVKAAVHRWAQEVWTSWAHEHETVRGWLAGAGLG
jgi:hypothetical protein